MNLVVFDTADGRMLSKTVCNAVMDVLEGGKTRYKVWDVHARQVVLDRLYHDVLRPLHERRDILPPACCDVDVVLAANACLYLPASPLSAVTVRVLLLHIMSVGQDKVGAAASH